jgi:hypothetical protein
MSRRKGDAMARKNMAGTAQAYVEGDLIKISIRVSLLPDVIKDSADGGHLDFGELGPPSVVDAKRFAKDVCNALNDEREDGTTPVHLLFDAAFEKAVEDGSLGIEFPKRKRGT